MNIDLNFTKSEDIFKSAVLIKKYSIVGFHPRGPSILKN